ncbi:MAG: hypothetical protein GY865_01745 [candidate division Zixibacteria bacterium]|nr:hypothetical protein [candidate division Zixibacteria bacterium]
MPPKTNTKVVSSLKGKAVDILEFGKDLYNENSIVLMPGKGCDKDVATSDHKSMMKLAASEGFAGLAAIIKQFSFDSRKRLILTGHTDPGGDHAANFTLGKNRAEAIYCLLTGKKDRWAKLAFDNQCIRDCKLLMTYFNFLGGDSFKDDTSCNPMKIDNEWDSENKTRDAVKGFFKGVKKKFTLGIDDADLAKKVEEDEKKKWPEVIWKSVFDMYDEQIRKYLKVDAPALLLLRTNKLKFAQAGKEFLGCGYSFPMTTPDDSKYQKEKYRRVEALFFYLDDVPARRRGTPRIVCFPATDKLHLENQCPFYHDKHFIANYLDALTELNMIAYHMKFDFHNLVQLNNDVPKIRQVPEGLTIKAYHYKKVGTKHKKEAILAITKYQKGVYTVKVPDDPKRKNIHFEFKSVTKLTPHLERWWVYTKDGNTEPKLEKKLDKDIKALMTPTDCYKRLSYYDLPHEWSSENYWTRYKDGASWKSGRFHDVLKTKLKLKPYDTKEADSSNPIIFSLDDIVLVDDKGKQKLTDKNKTDVNRRLSAASRLALLHVVKDELKLYKPRKNDSVQNPKVESACFSEIDFKKEKSGANDVWRNIITDVPGRTRGIMFCNKFYGIFDKRSGQSAQTFERKRKHIKGCREARLIDNDSHFKIKYVYKTYNTGRITVANNSDQVTGTGTRFLANVKPNYKIVVNRYERHTVKSVESNTTLTLTKNVSPALNNKRYKAVPHSLYSADGVGNYELFYIHYGSCRKSTKKYKGGYQARSFVIIYWNGRFIKDQKVLDPANNEIKNHAVSDIDMENYERKGLRNSKNRWEVKNYILEPAALDDDSKGNVQIKPVYLYEAKTATRGGRHKCEVKVSNDEGDGAMGVDSGDLFYEHFEDTDFYGNQITDAVDGKTYRCLIGAHEFGHAIGLDDDYMYDAGEKYIYKEDARFSNYYLGMPYQMNDHSMMNQTWAPRMRHFWHVMNHINTAADSDSAIKKHLKGTEYQLVYRFTKGGRDKTFRYRLKKSPNDYRDILKPYVEKRKISTGVGKVDLGLYKIGQGEQAHGIKVGPTPPGPVMPRTPFDGVLSVFIKIGVVYNNFVHPTDATQNRSWTDANKTWWSSSIKAKFNELNNRFFLKGTTADFQKTYIFFFPLVLEYSKIRSDHSASDATATRNAAHLTVTVNINNATTVAARTSPLTALTVNHSVAREWIVKCMLARDPGTILGHDASHTAWPNPTGNQAKITKTDLAFLSTWINSAEGLGGGAFEVKGS